MFLSSLNLIKKYHLKNGGYLLLLIIAYLLLICGLLSAWNTPCTGYEANIYTETPLIFWIGLFACYLIGIGMTIISTFYKKIPRYIVVASYLALILAFVSLLFLTVIRGYKILGMCTDAGAHIGNLATVVSSGVLINTYYPNIYLETGLFQILTGIDINTVLSLFPMLMIGLFTAEVYLLSKRIFPNKGEQYFVLLVSLFIPIGSFTLLGSLTLPFAGMTIPKFGLLSLFIFALFGVLSDSRKRFIWTLISLILIISIAFYHPNVAVMCGAISAGFFGYAFISHISRRNYSMRIVLTTFGIFLTSLAAFLLVQAERFSSLISSGFKSILSLLSEDPDVIPDSSPSVQTPVTSDPITTSPSTDIVSPVSPPVTSDPITTPPSTDIVSPVSPPVTSDTNILNLIAESDLLNSLADTGLSPAVGLFKAAVSQGYGFDTVLEVACINIFIYGMILVAGCLLVKKYQKSESYSLFKALFFCVSIVGAVMVVSMLGDFNGSYRRFLNPIYVLALLSTGFVLHQLLSKITSQFTKVSPSKIVVLFIILAVICFASVLTFHPSPNTLNMGYQTTQSELTAAETLLPRIDYSNQQTTGISNLGTGLHRYVHAIYGSPYTVGSYAGGEFHMVKVSKGSYSDAVPYHFGYDTRSHSLAESYNEGDYIFIEERNWESYLAYYPDIMENRWTLTDFNHLTADSGLEAVYDSGEVMMYVVGESN